MLLRVAFRNLFRQRRRTILTGLMMFFGTGLLSVGLGFSDGTYDYLIELFTRTSTGHVQIHKKGYLDRPSLYATVEDPDKLIQFLGNNVPELWTSRVISGGLAFVNKKAAGVSIYGVRPQRESAFSRLNEKIERGQYFSENPGSEVLIGSKLADLFSIGIGDEIVLVSQAADGSIANDVFFVRGVLKEGAMSQVEMGLIMDQKTAQNFFALYNSVHEIAFLFDHFSTSIKNAKKIDEAISTSDEWAALKADPWQVVEDQFYKQMQVDKKGNWISNFIISIMVAFGVLNTVLMLVLERTREYGLLKALGTSPKQIFTLVELEMTILAFFGAILGLIVSTSVNFVFSRAGIVLAVPLEFAGVKMDRMFSAVSWGSICLPLLLTLFSTVLVSWFPARRAARTAPVLAMRAE